MNGGLHMNDNLDYLDKGVKIGATLGGFIALRSLFKGTRMATNGVLRRAMKLRGKNGK